VKLVLALLYKFGEKQGQNASSLSYTVAAQLFGSKTSPDPLKHTFISNAGELQLALDVCAQTTRYHYFQMAEQNALWER
jgi:hypothetical protein